MSLLPLVKAWLLVCALASVAGWGLSALGQLNGAGYAIFLAVAVSVFFAGRKRAAAGTRSFKWRKLQHRFCRPLPLSFALLSLLIFLGPVLYAPTNHTAITYRLPRVLHWLAEGRWHWIHSANFRMNDRACGIEWLTAPIVLFTHSDRALFLTNFIPFLILPGLVFSLFTRLGVRQRVAWYWMWLLPTGYTFLVQAGSTGNDTFPTVFILAAVDFAARAWTSRRVSDLWYSLLAAALLTGAKASNIPLLLPWVLLFVPVSPLLLRRPIGTLIAGLVAATVSFLPTAILNVRYCGDWSGAVLEPAAMTVKNPAIGLAGNGFQLALNNFVPTFFPLASWWNRTGFSKLPHSLADPLVANFDTGIQLVGEIPNEDWAGLGFGLSVLAVIAAVAGLRVCRRGAEGARQIEDRDKDEEVSVQGAMGSRRISRSFLLWVWIAPWAALTVYCMKSGMVTAARLVSPYYPLLLPLLLAGAGQAQLARRRWWRMLVCIVVLLAFPVVVLTPGRPLWPAQTVLSRLHESHPGQRLIERALNVYSVYGQRSDPMANVRSLLPPDLAVVGFVGGPDDIDISLWRPLGKRVVKHILLTDSPSEIRERRLQYAVVGGFHLAANKVALTSWLQRVRAERIGTISATLTVTQGPQEWYVVRFL